MWAFSHRALSRLFETRGSSRDHICAVPLVVGLVSHRPAQSQPAQICARAGELKPPRGLEVDGSGKPGLLLKANVSEGGADLLGSKFW